jgi:hypothetical protein
VLQSVDETSENRIGPQPSSQNLGNSPELPRRETICQRCNCVLDAIGQVGTNGDLPTAQRPQRA